MTKNGQYSFWTEDDIHKVWWSAWRWGFAIGILTMLAASIGIILELADSLSY